MSDRDRGDLAQLVGEVHDLAGRAIEEIDPGPALRDLEHTAAVGQASKGILKRLRKHGFELLHDGESFFVDKSNHLEPAEVDRATAWGRSVAETAQSAG